jgi:hypothetical protein
MGSIEDEAGPLWEKRTGILPLVFRGGVWHPSNARIAYGVQAPVFLLAFSPRFFLFN